MKSKSQKNATPAVTSSVPSESESRSTVGPRPGLPQRSFLFGLPLYAEALILFLISFLFYANTLPNGYAVDDFDVILGNESVQGGVKYIPNILKNDEKAGQPVGAEEVNLFAGGRYRPLSLVMFAVEKSLAGENSPLLGHFINVLLYAILVALWWLVFRRYFFRSMPEAAFFACLLFAIHPVHTEVVANIKSRDEILCLFLLGLTVLLTFRAVERPEHKTGLLLGASGIFFLALLARETAFTFLLILPMSLFFFGQLFYKKPLSSSRILQFSGIVLASFVIYFMIRHQVLSQYKDMPFYEEIKDYRDELNDPFIRASFTEKYATVFYLLLKYLGMLFYPHPLSWDYSFPEIEYRNLSSPEVWLSLLINGGLLIYAFIRLPKRDPLSYAILFYFLAMSIVSNVFFAIGVAFAERFLFLPSMGWAMALAILLQRLVHKFPSLMVAVWGLVGLVTVAAFMKTFARNQVWESHERIALTDVVTCPKSAKTNINAGDTYMFKARSTADIPKKMQYLDSAKKYYGITLKVLPKWFNADSGYKTASLMKGSIFYEEAKKNDMQNGSLQKTMELLQKAAESAPMWGSPHMMMSVFYETRFNDPEKAYQSIKNAVKAAPDSLQYRYRLGQMAFARNDFQTAAEELGFCARKAVNNVDRWYDFGVAAIRAENKAYVKEAFEKVKALDPKRPIPPQAEAMMK